MNIFEYAAQNKLRFPSSRGGSLTVEDLYSLPLEGPLSLNAVAIDIHTKMKQQTVSFVSNKSPDKSLDVSLEIVKHVIAYKQAKNAERAKVAASRSERRMIQEALARKKEENLLASDVSVLEARLAELGED